MDIRYHIESIKYAAEQLRDHEYPTSAGLLEDAANFMQYLQDCLTDAESYLSFEQDTNNKLRTQIASFEAAMGQEPKHIAELRFTHGGYGCVLSTHVAYAMPEGTYKVYSAPIPFKSKQDEAVQYLYGRSAYDQTVSQYTGKSPTPEQVSGGDEPVSGVVIRDGSPSLLQDKFIKPTDIRIYTHAQPFPNKADIAPAIKALKDIIYDYWNGTREDHIDSDLIVAGEIAVADYEALPKGSTDKADVPEYMHEVVDVIKNLMDWQVKNVDAFDNYAYNDAHRLLNKLSLLPPLKDE